jgi:hypothetical protein
MVFPLHSHFPEFGFIIPERCFPVNPNRPPRQAEWADENGTLLRGKKQGKISSSKSPQRVIDL